MLMSLAGIIFGISFFVITQAQTSGFQEYFIKTILGVNGAIKISDRFQDLDGTVKTVSKNGKVNFEFKSRENTPYIQGIDYPEKLKRALSSFESIKGISEVFETNALANTKSRSDPVQVHGIRIKDHLLASEIRDQLIDGSIDNFQRDRLGLFIGNRTAQRQNLKLNDRVSISGQKETLNLRVSGIFESGISEIDKKRVYVSISTARSLVGKRFGGSFFQLGLKDPFDAEKIALQIQETIGHRSVSWQEREKVWLDVFRALRISSAITISSILMLSGLGIFNVFAIMVIEKTRDIAILRSIGFQPSDIASIFIWQGVIILLVGILVGVLFGALGTYVISEIPIQIRGIFKTDSFVVNWDISHYWFGILIASIFVGLASWIPARRAAKIEPAKIIRETI